MMTANRKDYSEAVALYNSGLSIALVARRYGITRQSMYEILTRRGGALRPQLRHGNANHFYRGGSRADRRAQANLRKAIDRGEVERPEGCQQCGRSSRFRDGRSGVQGHHTDYSKPLDVMWLCNRCHHEWHINHQPVEMEVVR